MSTRTAILDAASQVFADEGVGAASIGRIASSAGVTRPTVYAYFDTKEAIFTALVGEVRDAFLAAQEVPDTDDPVAVARAVITSYLALHVRHLPLLAAIDQRARTDPAVAAARDDLLARVHRRNARFVDRLTAAGRADPALDADTVSQAITGIVRRFAELGEDAAPAVRARLADDAVTAYLRLTGLH
ncbi:TetR family transcriptional regulator [Actinomycetospora sp. NBRC 106375]|uniref:TetR/AcrR family transcriptional regulator n=1 Tax=Actinomycetospora sp. NBRC 106375 TaxID=3032207 RepID=UPI00249FE86F|nr:TetR/AcrR family transcriptional regulator [Actinomycetospora sp. NBRC 106375]GLZ47912.1 TetR family transcriptional regulator [Actinomycetospora sp. NBRC 106375]